MIRIEKGIIEIRGSVGELLSDLANIVDQTYNAIKKIDSQKDAEEALQVAFYAGLYGKARSGHFEMETMDREEKRGSESLLVEFPDKLMKGVR